MSERCSEVEQRLVEAWLLRTPATTEDVAHAISCAGCHALRASLGEIGEVLATLDASGASDALVRHTQRRVRAELAAAKERIDEEAQANEAQLPAGFGRECARLLAAALAVLPLVLGWNWLVVSGLRSVLVTVLPEPLLGVVAGAYFASLAGWLAFLYGSIPFVAHRRARRLAEEVGS